MTTGERIKARRKALGMTQTELTELMGYANKSTVCKIEKGVWEPSAKLIMQFAAALRCTPQELMGWNETPTIADQVNDILRHMDEERQAQVLDYAKYIYQAQLKEKKHGI